MSNPTPAENADDTPIILGQDLTGTKFGRLTCIRFIERRGATIDLYQYFWQCQCTCGKLTAVRSTALRSGHSQSCGCLRTEATILRNKYTAGQLEILNAGELSRPDKKCNLCGVIKPRSDFYLLKKKASGRIKASSYCKECLVTKTIAGKKRWDLNNPYTAKQGRRRAYLKYRHGIAPEKVDAMIASQNGECAICGKKARLNLDHCHATGEFRAMLCHHCNCGLGHFFDDPDLIDKLSVYLRKWAAINKKIPSIPSVPTEQSPASEPHPTYLTLD
jgi:hypothetical protein